MLQYNKHTFFEKSNGGLDYIHHVYPQSIGFEDKKKGFKIRNERTGSARLSCKDGIWYVTDFGDDAKAKNAIEICMEVEALQFLDALKFLYAFAKIEGVKLEKYSAKWKQEPTDKDIDFYHVEFFEEPKHIDVFAPFLKAETYNEYNLKGVAYYQFVSFKKNKEGNPTAQKLLNTVSATDEYPIFAFDEGNFIKTYEPRADKAWRFRFFGKKPERYVYGLQRLLAKVNIELIRHLKKQIAEYAPDSTSSTKKELQEKLDKNMHESVFICSGGSDGLNVASLDKNAVWLNSESEILNYTEYHQLKEICKVIYSVPDIDAPGVKQGVKLGMEHLEIKTIWLPEKLKEQGKKDFRDWINSYKHLDVKQTQRAFDNLAKNALEFRWWRWNKKTATYKYNYVSLFYFLEHQGFYKYKLKHKNQQKGTGTYIFIHIDGNIVREVTAPDIKSFVQEWLKENNISLEVLNMVMGSQFLNDKGLLTLKDKEIDFTIAGRNDQLFFFDKKIVKVTAEGIEQLRPNDVKNLVWENKVIRHNIRLKEPQFKIFKDNSGNWDIEVNEKNNMFFNYLINASRIHWRAELEAPFAEKSEKLKKEYHEKNRFNIAGPNLSPDEIHEQKLHLINKIYALGYLLHSYKDDAKPWCVYVMDNKLPEVSTESHGGSGKSFGVSKVLEFFKSAFYLEGRNPRLLDNQFIYDGVDEDIDTVFMDDAHYTMNFGFFFSILTGSMKVNPKHGKQFEIPFNKSPKLVITTNYVPQSLEPSTLRRLLFMVYSDYYHEKTDEYFETRQITDDFGGKKMFREEFTDTDYNLFFNFCLQALQFYLSCNEKINAPDGNVRKRNLMQVMGDGFYEWAKSYFNAENLDTYILRPDVQNDYKNFVGGKALSVNRQKKALEAFCKLNGWIFNPVELQGSDGTIKKAVDNYNGKRCVLEHYYINTTGSKVMPDATGSNGTATNNDGAPGDDLPF